MAPKKSNTRATVVKTAASERQTRNRTQRTLYVPGESDTGGMPVPPTTRPSRPAPKRAPAKSRASKKAATRKPNAPKTTTSRKTGTAKRSAPKARVPTVSLSKSSSPQVSPPRVAQPRSSSAPTPSRPTTTPPRPRFTSDSSPSKSLSTENLYSPNSSGGVTEKASEQVDRRNQQGLHEASRAIGDDSARHIFQRFAPVIESTPGTEVDELWAAQLELSRTVPATVDEQPSVAETSLWTRLGARFSLSPDKSAMVNKSPSPSAHQSPRVHQSPIPDSQGASSNRTISEGTPSPVSETQAKSVAIPGNRSSTNGSSVQRSSPSTESERIIPRTPSERESTPSSFIPLSAPSRDSTPTTFVPFRQSP